MLKFSKLSIFRYVITEVNVPVGEKMSSIREVIKVPDDVFSEGGLGLGKGVHCAIRAKSAYI